LKKMAYPYYGPAWYPQPPPQETKNGLRHLVKAMYFSLAMMMLSMILVVILYASVSSFADMETGTEAGTALGAIALVAIFGLVIVIIGLVTFVLYLMGLVEMYKGRNEFGPSHAKRVNHAIVFIVLSIILTVAGVVITVVLALNSMAWDGTGTVDMTQYRKDLMLSQAVGGVFTIVSAVFYNLALVNMIFELSDGKHRGHLWTAFWVGLGISILGVAVNLIIIAVQTNSLGDLNSSSVFTYLTVGLSLVSFLIYLVCYRSALGRLESGELKPILPPPMPMYAPAAYYPPPAYYYGAPPPAYYQQSPPTWSPPPQQAPPPTGQQAPSPVTQQPAHELRPQPVSQDAQKPAQPPQQPPPKKDAPPPVA
jgi:MFS family permease